MSQAEQLCTSCTRGWESADAIRIIKVTTKYKQGEIKCKQSGTKIKLRTKKMILCIFLMIKIKTAASLPDRICDPNILTKGTKTRSRRKIRSKFASKLGI